MNSTETDLSQYRAFWRRLGAAFLDSAALAPLQWIDRLVWNSFAAGPILLGWSLVQMAASLVITVGMVAKYGQTPGKMACGVKIVTLTHSPVSLKHAVLRHVVGILMVPFMIFLQFSNVLNGELANRGMGSYRSLMWFGGIIMVWVLLEFITMLTNKRRRAIHDFIAGTVVVKEPIMTRKWVMWLLVFLFVLNMVIPHFIPDTNMVIGSK